jgi:hypothetical protein
LKKFKNKKKKRSRFKTNQVSYMENRPDRKQLEDLVPNMQFRRMLVSELPEEIKSNELTKKFDSAIVAASGSPAHTAYWVMGIRPDNNEIDEHPFVYHFQNDDLTADFGAIIHHGDWIGRTTQMTPEQLECLDLSGTTASFSYKGIPPGGTGSLDELRQSGLLTGLSSQWSILLEEMEKNKNSG